MTVTPPVAPTDNQNPTDRTSSGSISKSPMTDTANSKPIPRSVLVFGATGHNFVRTMQKLAADGVSPTVVADQVGRLTFTEDLSLATHHLVSTGAPYGVYPCRGDDSWIAISCRGSAPRP